MKIQITVTKSEVKNTEDTLYVDPCKHIRCGSIDCEACPLHDAARAYREAQEAFFNILNGFSVIEDE